MKLKSSAPLGTGAGDTCKRHRRRATGKAAQTKTHHRDSARSAGHRIAVAAQSRIAIAMMTAAKSSTLSPIPNPSALSGDKNVRAGRIQVAGWLGRAGRLPAQIYVIRHATSDLNCSNTGATALSLYGWHASRSCARNAKRINLV